MTRVTVQAARGADFLDTRGRAADPWGMGTISRTPIVMASVLFGTLVGSRSAVADVLPPEVADCQSYSLDAGNPCTLGKSTGSSSSKPGICVISTCSRLDYANWDRDASPGGPPSTTYACLMCVAGGAIDGGSSDGVPGDVARGDATGADHTGIDGPAVDAPFVFPADAGSREASAPRVDLGGQAGASGTAGASGQVDAPGAGGVSGAAGASGAAGNSGQAGASGTASGQAGASAAGASGTVSGAGGVSGTAGAWGAAGSSGQGGIPGLAPTTVAGGTSGTYTTSSKSNNGGGCAMGGAAARALGPWLLAGVFGVLVSLIRRRR